MLKIAVITDKSLKKELLLQSAASDIYIEWLTEPQAVNDVDACIDLLYEPATKRIHLLQQLTAVPVIINDVPGSPEHLPENFIRINGWKSFLQRPVTEAAARNDHFYFQAEQLFAALGKKMNRVPDIPGLVTARVVSMIINEAWLTFEEGVSTKEEIDKAMKLGTSYPYGPFEWGNIIGLKNVYALLLKLAASNNRFTPSAWLKNEAQKA